MLKRTFGLDLHRDRIYVTMLNANDGVAEQYEIATRGKEFEAFLATIQPGDQVALEATRGCNYYYQRLLATGASVFVANPSKVRFFTEETAKSDRNDACSLALLLSIGALPTIWMPSPETQEDREVIRHRFNLVHELARVKNRVRAQMAEHGMLWEGSDVSDGCAPEILDEASAPTAVGIKEVLNSHLAQIDHLNESISKIDQVILVRAERWPEVKLLMTIRGINVLTAFTLMATIGKVDRFLTADSLANYAGLVPSQCSSAGKTRNGRITKAGPKALRWALTEAVQSLCRVDGHYRNLCKRLERKKKGKGIAATACARKLLKAIWCMLSRNEPFHHADPDLVDRKAQRREQLVKAARPVVEERRKRHHQIILHQLALAQELARRRIPLAVPKPLQAVLAIRSVAAAAS